MPRLAAIFAACAAAAVAHAAPAARHISEAVDLPTIVTVPELRVPRPGYAALAAMPSAGSVGLSHSFTGITDVGFVDFKCVA